MRRATASKIWSLDGFNWTDDEYIKKREKKNHHSRPMSIYELHLGSWRTKEGYKYPSVYELADELAAYVKEMGYTHIELMPITEFPF